MIAVWRQLRHCQRGIPLEGRLRIQHEGPLLPLYVDERERLLGDGLAVGGNRDSHFLPLEVRNLRDDPLHRDLVSAEVRNLR